MRPCRTKVHITATMGREMSKSHVRRIITSQGTKSSTYRTHLHNPLTTENQTHLQTHHITVLETDPSQEARLIWNHHITEHQTNLQRVLTSLRGSLIFKILTLQTNSLISRDSSHHTEAVSSAESSYHYQCH